MVFPRHCPGRCRKAAWCWRQRIAQALSRYGNRILVDRECLVNGHARDVGAPDVVAVEAEELVHQLRRIHLGRSRVLALHGHSIHPLHLRQLLAKY